MYDILDHLQWVPMLLLFAPFFILIFHIVDLRYRFNGGWFRRYCDHLRPDLKGKCVIVTGGNSGIGRATAVEFAKRGARVIIACRNETKANEAIKKIQKSSGNSSVIYMPLELSDQESIREFAKAVLKQESKIDYLVNNAGLAAAAPGHRTEDGYYMVFAVNHLGHFLLTMLLLDRLKESAPSRIINVAGIYHTTVKPEDFDFTPKNKEGHSYPNLRGYDRSKLANILFTKELARQLAGTKVTTYAVHPGAIVTNMYASMRDATNMPKGVYWRLKILSWLFGSNGRAGAQTTMYCALEKSITKKSGGYFDNCQVAEESELARDEGVAKKLWDLSLQATGI